MAEILPPEGWLARLEPTSDWIANLDTRVLTLAHDRLRLPLTVNDAEYANSYVCSPYTACVSYAREELRNLPVRAPLALLLDILGLLLRRARINRVLHVNNWLLSTNLYPEWDGQGLAPITALLRERWPDHAILFRSLNRRTNGPLMEAFRARGYRLVPSRQVYFFAGDQRAHANARRDERLLETTAYRVVPHAELRDFPRIQRLYDQLYLEKYSYHNPQFRARLLELWWRLGFLEMTGLATSEGRLDGVVGWFAVDGVMTVPLVGYDTALPQSLGLYRLLMALALRTARERGWLLNLSAGAAGFKRLRGGQPEMEYSALYVRHLPLPRRLVWGLLAGLLTGVAAPLLRLFRL